MKSFNVIIENVNSRKFESYDVIPYLVECYKKLKPKERPKTFDEFKEFIRRTSTYQWWAKCEYEIVLQSWVGFSKEEKIDVHYQVMMNLDIITEIVIQEVCS